MHMLLRDVAMRARRTVVRILHAGMVDDMENEMTTTTTTTTTSQDTKLGNKQ